MYILIYLYSYILYIYNNYIHVYMQIYTLYVPSFVSIFSKVSSEICPILFKQVLIPTGRGAVVELIYSIFVVALVGTILHFTRLSTWFLGANKILTHWRYNSRLKYIRARIIA